MIYSFVWRHGRWWRGWQLAGNWPPVAYHNKFTTKNTCAGYPVVQTFGAIFNLWSTLQHSDLLYPSNILPCTAVNKSDATAGASHNPEGASYLLLYSKPGPAAPPQTWDDADNLSIVFTVQHIFNGPEQVHCHIPGIRQVAFSCLTPPCRHGQQLIYAVS